jgi:hypothetical protein
MAAPSRVRIQLLPLLRVGISSLLRETNSPAGASVVSGLTRRGRVCDLRGRVVENSNARSKDAVAIFFNIAIISSKRAVWAEAYTSEGW